MALLISDYIPNNTQTAAVKRLPSQTTETKNSQSFRVTRLKRWPKVALSFRARNAFSIAAAFCLTCMVPRALAHTCQASPVIACQQIGNLG
jgi:hypothetical protein